MSGSSACASSGPTIESPEPLSPPITVTITAAQRVLQMVAGNIKQSRRFTARNYRRPENVCALFNHENTHRPDLSINCISPELCRSCERGRYKQHSRQIGTRQERLLASPLASPRRSFGCPHCRHYRTPGCPRGNARAEGWLRRPSCEAVQSAAGACRRHSQASGTWPKIVHRPVPP